MTEYIDIRDLYTSIAKSVDDANRLLGEVAEDTEFSYAITELDFSVPFNELTIEEERAAISLPKETDEVSEVRNLKFKVRFVPRTTMQQAKEEEPVEPEAMVPDLLNASLEDAKKRIKAWGLKLGNVRYDPTRGPAGQVVSQTPAPLRRAASGTQVNLVVAGKAPRSDTENAPPESTEERP